MGQEAQTASNQSGQEIRDGGFSAQAALVLVRLANLREYA